MVYLDEQVIRQLYDAFNNHNFEVIVKLYADDVRVICPGRSRISGEYHGRQEVLGFWTKQFEISEKTFHANVLGVAEADEHIVVITEVGLQRGAKSYSWRRILHFVMYDARVKECWIFESDQYLADEAFE